MSRSAPRRAMRPAPLLLFGLLFLTIVWMICLSPILRKEATRMSSPSNRTIPLSPARRLACDVLHFGQKVPLVVLERRMRLAEVARARAAIPPKPTWFAVFAKAYGIIAARRPALRRSYLSLPWPRLFEHARNIPLMPIQ